MQIEDYIGCGHVNAVTRKELIALTQTDDRAVRDMIEDARARGIQILNLSDGKGYFIVGEDEGNLLDRWNRQQWSRVKNIIRTIKGVNGNKIPGQLSFDELGGE